MPGCHFYMDGKANRLQEKHLVGAVDTGTSKQLCFPPRFRSFPGAFVFKEAFVQHREGMH